MQRVPLSPDLNLTLQPDRVRREVSRIAAAFRGLSWYIQSSFALWILGVRERAVTDIDIRVDATIETIFQKASAAFPDVKVRPPVRYGRGEFRNECVVIGIDDTHIDITGSRLSTYNSDDNMEYVIPFDRRASMREVFGVRVPVCSIEYLIVYKLINRRGSDERKNDLREVTRLLEIWGDSGRLPFR